MNEAEQNFLKLALRSDLLEEDQVETCRRLREEAEARGETTTVVDIVRSRGMLSTGQIKAIERRTNERVVGGHRILSKVGSGGMGTVYRAQHVRLEKVVALKVLPARVARDEKVRLRFEREARCLAQTNHPNIVRAFDFGEDQNLLYISMELVGGRSLHDRIEDEGRIEEKEALQIVVEVARGLDHAGSRGLIHRDIKPDNILQTREGVAKITDFGIVKPTYGDSRLQTTVGVSLGTPDFMSPEQALADQSIDTRSDLYSLGATLYYILCGQTPYPEGNDTRIIERHLYGPIPDPRQVVPALSESTSQIVGRLMAKAPDDRYQTPAALIEDLERALAGKPLGSPPAAGASGSRSRPLRSGSRSGPRRASRRSPSRKPLVVAVFLALLLIGLLVAFVAA